MRFLLFLLLLTPVIFAQYDTLRTDYPDGTTKELIPRYEKRIEGIARFFYPNGNIQEERSYRAGKVDGLVKQYDSLGRLLVTFSIEGGKREGPCTYFLADGTIDREVFYVNGQIEIPDTTGIPEDALEVASQVADAAPPAAVEEKSTIVKEIAPRPIVTSPVVVDTLLPLLAMDTLYVDYTIANNPLIERLSSPPAPRIGWDSLQNKVVYPAYAIEKGITGTVRIKALISVNGDVVTREALTNLGYSCEDAALIAVYFTRFYPAEVNGKAKPAYIIFDISFNRKKA